MLHVIIHVPVHESANWVHVNRAAIKTVIEHILFEMHLKHRMRAFQGTFHANPDYALWYGWSEMVRDLAEIKEKAAELRARKGE